MKLYRYFSDERHAIAVVRWGEMLMRTAAYFHHFEDGDVRGDRRDATLVYAPEGGLRITKQDGTEIVAADTAFVAAARHADIFIQCFSTVLSPELHKRFDAPFCVEVEDDSIIADRLKARAHPTSEIDYAALVARPVEYRPRTTELIVDWALPERIVFMKPEHFAWQEEYRFAVGRHGAFDPENVNLTLETGLSVPTPAQGADGHIILRVGDLRKYAKLLHGV